MYLYKCHLKTSWDSSLLSCGLVYKVVKWPKSRCILKILVENVYIALSEFASVTYLHTRLNINYSLQFLPWKIRGLINW